MNASCVSDSWKCPRIISWRVPFGISTRSSCHNSIRHGMCRTPFSFLVCFNIFFSSLRALLNTLPCLIDWLIASFFGTFSRAGGANLVKIWRGIFFTEKIPFFLDPAEANSFPREYLERVQQVHSKGGYGSIGYNTVWEEAETRKNILRTHTTAVSARMLHKLAQQVRSLYFAIFFSICRSIGAE